MKSRNQLTTGFAALAALAYCGMFFFSPATAINLGNNAWAFPVNVFGFFVFLGGWAVALELLRKEPWRWLVFLPNAVLVEMLAFLSSPMAQAFVRTNPGRYFIFCVGFLGPTIGALYILWLIFRRSKTVPS